MEAAKLPGPGRARRQHVTSLPERDPGKGGRQRDAAARRRPAASGRPPAGDGAAGRAGGLRRARRGGRRGEAARPRSAPRGSSCRRLRRGARGRPSAGCGCRPPLSLTATTTAVITTAVIIAITKQRGRVGAARAPDFRRGKVAPAHVMGTALPPGLLPLM